MQSKIESILKVMNEHCEQGGLIQTMKLKLNDHEGPYIHTYIKVFNYFFKV